MDGIESRRGVFLMAATNRPDIIDPAVLRPGRLDKILHVGFPTAEDRVDILRALTKVWLGNYFIFIQWILNN
jgi:ribosome biogenesis ATPase